MPGRSNRESRTTGRTGQLSEGGTASTSGQMLQRSSSPMAPMAGSGSSWMGSWPPCTPVGVQRGGRTAPVPTTHSIHTLYWC